MEAAKLGCIGSPLPLCPSRGSSRGTSGSRVFSALKSSTSSLSCDCPPSPSTLSPQLSLLSVVGTLANFVCLPLWASEEDLEGSPSATSSLLAAATAVSTSTQVAESAEASVGSAVQSSVESAGKAIVADAGDSNLVINILGSAAFVGLALLSIGIVYLAVTDFLEKRKSDEEAKRLNEEAAAAKKKQPGSLTAASKGGAKGFGKKRQDDE